MENIEAKKKSLVEEFGKYDKWEDKYKRIIQIGKELDAPEEIQIEKYLVKGCQSQVWLHAKQNDGRIYFEGTSDAMIVKGLLALLVYVFSGQKIEDVMMAKADFVTDLGLNVHLSQSRSNGLAAMIKQMKLYAMAFNSINLQKDNL